MPKYLVQAILTPGGTKGTLKDGGTSRRKSVETAFKSAGGKVEAFYYAFGKTDVYIIADMPSDVAMAGVAMRMSSSGAVATHTTVLLTPEEVDRASVTMSKVVYRAPGK